MASTARPQVPSAHGPVAYDALPGALRNVAYSGARHPGAGTPECPSRPAGPGAAGPGAPPDLGGGANCQRYAYTVLGHFGLRVPPLRSAELWADRTATRRAVVPEPLDLVLFDAGSVAGRPAGYGAHVGVHLGPDRVLHLCREVGRPVVWSYADFAARPRYARFLGAKRVPAGGSGEG
ncbi:cell wall hydrolase [Streptomyces sp. CB02959]|uniref:cell wall hydrolase n=1 Tax=Streptomyces sp. CB02959 TaxID=2020330 RepID=UPI000C27436F|nr:cell wall hydrolase [Streptomyces sp. CB02959]PJN41952.1 cell wall hydrolase [Streptomyces sp. CB02959]